MSEKSNKNTGFALVILASILYGIMPSLSQRAYAAGLSVESVINGRYLIGTTLIWIFIFATKKPLKVGKTNVLLLMAVGVNVFVCVFCMTSSYYYIPGAVASLLVFLYIVFVNVIEMLTGKEKPKAIRLVCLVLTIIGMVFVVYTPSGGTALSTKGIILALIAGVLYSIWAMAMGAKRFAPFSAEVTMGYMLIVPTVCNVIKCLQSGSPLLPETPTQWLFIILLGLTPGFLAPISFCAGVKKLGAGTASMINTSEPVFAYFAGMAIMGDKLSLNASIGGAVVVVGILILNISERNKS
jgi:drug/metabolite transporter (DMT)-like permease